MENHTMSIVSQISSLNYWIIEFCFIAGVMGREFQKSLVDNHELEIKQTFDVENVSGSTFESAV